MIRLATLADIEPVMHIVKAVVPGMNAAGIFQWDDSYPNAGTFELDISLGQLWIAEIDGIVAGFAAITTEQYPEYADAGLDITEPAIVTHRLAVSPPHRGKGIAAALLAQAEQVAVDKRFPALRIDTNAINLAAQRLFVQAGYVFAGEMGLVFRPGLRFFCYEKRL